MATLQHVGVLGMHWGVRKARPPSHPDHVRATELKRKKLNELSNDELKTLTARMQLERQFKELSSKDVSLGKKIVTEMLVNVAKQEAVAFATTLSKSVGPKIFSAIKSRVDEANKKG